MRSWLVAAALLGLLGGCEQPAPSASRRGTEPSLPASERRTAVVARVIDGDTLVLRNGRHLRIIGIDTPERGECGYDAATRHLAAVVGHRRVVLVSPAGENHTDAYDRILRYVLVDGVDAGLAQLRGGFAVARYDSLDGYPHHPRQARYRRAAQASSRAHAALTRC